MDDIPVGFFQLPELEYLEEEPGTPYKFPTSGMLHSNKFKNILKNLIENMPIDIFNIMESHRLQKDLEYFSRSQLADFCRHILYINRDKIGWQVVDKYLALLTKAAGLAGWEKIDIIFLDKSQELFSALIKWELGKYQTDLVKQYLGKAPRVSLDNSLIEEKLTSNYQFWKFRDLWILFEDLIYFKNISQDEFKPMQPLLDLIVSLFEDELRKMDHDPLRKIVLITILSRGYVKLGYEKIGELFDLSSRVWIEIQNQSKELELKSYRYLMAIIFGQIGLEYYQYNISFVYRRQMINRILDNYFKFDEISLGEWLDHLMNSEIDLLLKEYLLSGFSVMERLLWEYTLGLSESSTKKELRSELLDLSSNVINYAIQFLNHILGSNGITNREITVLRGMQETERENRKIIRGLIECIVHSYKNLCYQEESHDEIDLETVGMLYGLIEKPVNVNLYLRHLELLTDSFQIENFLTKIEYEIKDTGSIISSSSFESEIISLAGQVMEEVRSLYGNTKKSPLIILQQLFYYLNEWLQIFYNRGNLYEDVVLILSPIISIIHVQIIQAYYEKTQHGLGLVEYLNFQYMASVFRNEYNLVGTSDMPITTSYLADEYREMIKDWNIVNITGMEKLVKSIKSLQLKFINQKSETSGMIEDDIMMGYLNLASEIEEIIETGVDGIMFYTLGDKFFKKSEPGMHLYSHIAKNRKEKLKIPLFQNPNQYNSALSVIPFNVNISGTMVDLDIDSLLAYFEIPSDGND